MDIKMKKNIREIKCPGCAMHITDEKLPKKGSKKFEYTCSKCSTKFYIILESGKEGNNV